jgi:hypothetical protein
VPGVPGRWELIGEGQGAVADEGEAEHRVKVPNAHGRERGLELAGTVSFETAAAGGGTP